MPAKSVLSIDKVIEAMKYYRPHSVDDLLNNCQFTLRLVSNGAFRYVYDIVGSKPALVVKVPAREGKARDLSLNIRHAKDEFRAWRRITHSKRKYKYIQGLMPDIYYFSHVSGITVMRRYGKVPYGRYKKLRTDICTLTNHLMRANGTDVLREDNYGTEKGKLKIIDLGCFLRGIDGAFKR